MRVANYSQPATATHSSLLAWIVLVVTVLLGTSSLHSVVLHYAPQFDKLTASYLWLLLYLLAFLGLMLSQGINWISWLVRYRILLVILLLGTVASLSWSLDPQLSAERVVHLLGCSIVAVYLGFMVPLLTILRISAFVLGIVMVASVAVALWQPEFGIENYEGELVWKGVLNSKNSLGFWSAISVLLFATLSDSARRFSVQFLCWMLALVSVGVLIMSESATSQLAMVIGGALSLYLFFAHRFELGFVRMLVMALLFIGLASLAVSSIDTAELLGRSGDLTGRGEVWRQTWNLIMQEPLKGYGYGALWFPNEDTIWIQQKLTDFSWVVYHAHNGFLQVASEIGLPLSVVALLMIAQQLIEIFYCQYQRQQSGVLFVLAFVIALLISNFSEARFLINRELYWIFFIALPMSMLRQITLVAAHPDDRANAAADFAPAGAGSAEAFNDDYLNADDRAEYDPGQDHEAEPAEFEATDADGEFDTDVDDTAETGTGAGVERSAPQSEDDEFEPNNQYVEWDDETQAPILGDLTMHDPADIDLGGLADDHTGLDEADETLENDLRNDLNEALKAELKKDRRNQFFKRPYEEIDEDPHDQVIEPTEEDLRGLEDLDDFDDDDHFDRLKGDER